MYINFWQTLPCKQRGLKGICGKDLSGLATTSLLMVDDDGSSVDVEGVGILGVVTEPKELCCTGNAEEATGERDMAAGGIFKDLHHFFKDTKN